MTAPDDGLREAAQVVVDAVDEHLGSATFLNRLAALRAALRSTPATPHQHDFVRRDGWWCACGEPFNAGEWSEDAAPQPDPCSHGFSGEPCEVHRHLWAVAEPCRDGEHASCPGRDEDGNECGCLCGHVGETAHSSPPAAPQPDTALTVEPTDD